MFSDSLIEIAVIGIVATAYMTFFHGMLIREHVAKHDVIRAIGAFVMPTPLRNRGFDLWPHFIGGLFFAAVYSFLFNFMVAGRDIQMFVIGGIVIGMVHGYFISFFLLFGMSSSAVPSRDADADLRVASANIVLHMIFGMIAGLGFAAKAYSGSVLWFAIFGMGILLILKALSVVVFKKEKTQLRASLRMRLRMHRPRPTPMPAER